MDVYNTEEEQVQAIKQWWKENAVSLIAGIVIGIVVLVGYKYWTENEISQSQQASALFSQILAGGGDQSKNVEVLKSDFSSTPYAALSALLAAKNNILANETDKAISQLKWILDNNSDEGIEHIARQRLSRIYLAQDKIDEAESLIKGIKEITFSSTYNEIRGDIYLAKKLIVQAKESYKTALATLPRGDRRYEIIKMKLDDLAQENKVSAK